MLMPRMRGEELFIEANWSWRLIKRFDDPTPAYPKKRYLQINLYVRMAALVGCLSAKLL